MNDLTTNQAEHALAALRYQTAARDLEHIVRNIAARYIVQQVPLTWRLLQAIEAEALADLGFASRHDAIMLGLFQRPSAFRKRTRRWTSAPPPRCRRCSRLPSRPMKRRHAAPHSLRLKTLRSSTPGRGATDLRTVLSSVATYNMRN
jgi:hypothetical protein